jgi:CLIP-associating protein 1/2
VKAAASPRTSPAKAKPAPRAPDSNSPSKAHEELTLVVPGIPTAKTSPPVVETPPKLLVENIPPGDEASPTSSKFIKVYEDPFTEDQTTPRPVVTAPVLEDKPVNEDAANLRRSSEAENDVARVTLFSPEKAKQNSRLLDSGIARIKAKTLDVHSFRRLQDIIRNDKATFTDDKFDALLLGLFEFLKSPLSNLAPEKVSDTKAQEKVSDTKSQIEKVSDTKAQILQTIRLLRKKTPERFQPHVSRSLECLLVARSAYEARTHIVSGLEILADELITLGDASEIALVLTKMLQGVDTDAKGCRILSMGLHVLKEVVDKRPAFQPTDSELGMLGGLAERCLESTESAVRMDAVQLCVSLHARVGDARFWDIMRGVKDDPKSLITYYIVKRQRETGTAAAA